MPGINASDCAKPTITASFHVRDERERKLASRSFAVANVILLSARLRRRSPAKRIEPLTTRNAEAITGEPKSSLSGTSNTSPILPVRNLSSSVCYSLCTCFHYVIHNEWSFAQVSRLEVFLYIRIELCFRFRINVMPVLFGKEKVIIRAGR